MCGEDIQMHGFPINVCKAICACRNASVCLCNVFVIYFNKIWNVLSVTTKNYDASQCSDSQFFSEDIRTDIAKLIRL